MITENERKVCACGRKYIAQSWKTEAEKAKCFTCFVKENFTKEVFGELSPREQKILDTRFGLTNGVTYTLEETGKIFGVTRERVRQIEAKAIERLNEYKSKKVEDTIGK